MKKLVIVFLLVVVVIVVFSYKKIILNTSANSQDEILTLKTETTKILTSSNGGDINYLNFLKNLDSICPFYIPNGVIYRDCLAKLLAKKEVAVEDLYKEIISSKENNQMKQYSVTRIKEFQSLWKPYRDALCAAQFSSVHGGSNESGMINTCKIYQTDVYAHHLVGFD